MAPGRIKELVSYVLPLQIEACSSKFNAYLEVVLSRGRYVLNSKDTNYSFGSLHTIFQNVFREINIDALNISSCLLLGLGGGSVMQLLRKKYRLNMPVTSVEIDPVVIQLGHKYFNFGDYKNFSIINDDALNYVKNCSTVYDLIIVDIYINNEVPRKFHTTEFILCLKNISHANTIILFNKMLGNKTWEEEYTCLISEMTKTFGAVISLPYRVNGTENRIICVNTSKTEVKQKIGREEITGGLPHLLLDPG